MAKSVRRRGPVNLALAATAVTMAAGSVMPTTASPIQDAYYAHTELCIDLLFNDKAAHNAQCLPNSSSNSPAYAGGGGSDVPLVVAPPPVVVLPPVVVAPPPPPVVIPPPEVGSSYPEVDSSYPQA